MHLEGSEEEVMMLVRRIVAENFYYCLYIILLHVNIPSFEESMLTNIVKLQTVILKLYLIVFNVKG
jgi:hypothetical protein